ncbi:hypothetical protein WJ973_20750 [Achromobacter xylosoxidans]
MATDAARALLADLHAAATAAAWPRMSRIALALEALPEVKHAEAWRPRCGRCCPLPWPAWSASMR